MLPDDKMPEAEVALRFAFYLLGLPEGGDRVEVAIDGAAVKTKEKQIFPLPRFLQGLGWKLEPSGSSCWQGFYRKGEQQINVSSRPGVEDLVAEVGGKAVRVECKGGSTYTSSSGKELVSLRNALAQILTLEKVRENDVLVAAVPDTPKFRKLAEAWRSRPLVYKCGIQIVLVGRCGSVSGLSV